MTIRCTKCRIKAAAGANRRTRAVVEWGRRGGLSLKRALMGAGLVDRVQVTPFPVASGSGGEVDGEGGAAFGGGGGGEGAA